MKMNNNNYYNTTNEVGDKLNQYREKARNQDIEILEIFKKKYDTHLSCNDIEDILAEMGRVYPRTSVGRSINTLTKEGKLEKTLFKKIGRYGRNCYTWKLKNN